MDCPVTVTATADLPPDVAARGADWVGSGDLYVAVQTPDYGGYLTEHGDYQFKLAWLRRVPGEIQVSARQLDGDGRLRAVVPESTQPPTGPLPTLINFPQPGCWHVTGRLGHSSADVVVAVYDTAD
jgi:hypothetical protein